MHVVTGMHRSGTSFVSQALHELGADFGDLDLLLSADRWNQNGYFESIDVIDINNRAILGPQANIEHWLAAPETVSGRIINSVQSGKWKYFLFPSIHSINARAVRWEAEMRDLHARYRDCYVKDPRFCLTLGAWVRVGPVDSAVFSYRNPAAVAGSIKRREGLPRWFGARYWLYHIQSFFAQLPPDIPLFLVDFDEFFDADTQPAAFERLRKYVCREHRDVGLEKTLDIRLRTQSATSHEVPRRVRQAYDALKELMSVGDERGVVTIGDHPSLQRIILGQ